MTLQCGVMGVAVVLVAVAAAVGAAAPAKAPAAAAPAPSLAGVGQPVVAGVGARIYVGTYTGQSKGIYTLTLDRTTGALSAPEVAAETPNPSFLALDPSGRFLYAANETSNFGGQKTGSVTAFAVTPETGKLKALGQQPSGGAAPCHLVVDSASKHVLVANYGSGTIEILPIGADGSLGAPSQTIQHAGSGPNRGRQEAPHAHGVGFDPAGKIALAADLGADKIFVYQYDAVSGKLSVSSRVALSASPPEAGAGPRHFAFSPSGKFLYEINELNSTVGVYSYDAASGALAAVQSVSTVAPGAKGGSAAEVAVHPSGKFVYASTRGTNTLAAYAVDPVSGKLTPVGFEPTQGGGPRHFAIDPTGAYLIVANQDAGNLVVFKIDPATGKLKATGGKAQVPQAVCVTFLTGTK
jgi:6-phosphogluconolactonase